MKVINPGHKYMLSNFENKKESSQILQFIHKEPIEEGSIELKTINDGTTNEEVLAVLIDRLNFLYNKFPSTETQLAITKLEEALALLNQRTQERIDRGVEGKQTI